MLDTIIFDAEGVVIDSECIWDEEQKIFLNRRGFVYNRDMLKPLMTGISLAEGVSVMQTFYGFKGNIEELVAERKAIAKDMFKDKVRYIEGFKDFYCKIKKKYKVCIATSMNKEILEMAVRQLALSELFNNNIFSIADVGYISKPHPDLFLYAARKLDSLPESCVVIEDAPYGVEAAKRAGMQCIALATTYEKNKLLNADLVVASYSQLSL